MVDSSDDYAKYQPRIEYPKAVKKPYIGNYNMNNPEDIRKYADAMAEYNEKADKINEALSLWRQSKNQGIKLFHDDLMKEDLQNGIGLDALEEAWHIAQSHGNDFAEWEDIYEEIAQVARLAHRHCWKKLHDNN